MTWELLLPIIAKYGLPLAEELWQLASSGGQPTPADWKRLRELANQTGHGQLKDAIERAGIALDHPDAVALLALAGKVS